MKSIATIFSVVLFALSSIADENIATTNNTTTDSGIEVQAPKLPELPTEKQEKITDENLSQDSNPSGLTVNDINDSSVRPPEVIDMVPAYNESVIKSQEPALNTVEFQDQWIRMPATTSVNTAAYFNITNNSDKDIKITDVQSIKELSERIEIHGYKPDDNGVKKMFKLESVTIPAKSTIEFKPGSFHIMIMGLKTTFTKGNNYQLKFIIKPASEGEDNTYPDQIINFPVK